MLLLWTNCPGAGSTLCPRECQGSSTSCCSPTSCTSPSSSTSPISCTSLIRCTSPTGCTSPTHTRLHQHASAVMHVDASNAHQTTVFTTTNIYPKQLVQVDEVCVWFFCRAAPISAASGCRGGEAAGAGGSPGVPLHLPHSGSLPVLPHPLCQHPRPAGRCRSCAPSHGCSRLLLQSARTILLCAHLALVALLLHDLTELGSMGLFLSCTVAMVGTSFDVISTPG